MTKTDFKQLANQLNKFESFAIICHVRPDGDAIGSAISLKKGLQTLGKKAEVFCDDVIPEKFQPLVDISVFSSTIGAKYDAFVAVDCADEYRLGNLYADFSKCKNTFNIDHHVSNTCYAKFNLVEDNSSNCENIYNLLTAMGVKISKDIADAILMGISTDTGNFAHKGLEKSTFVVAGELIEKGADINKIYYQMFCAQTRERAKLFALVNSSIRYALDGKLGVAVITRDLIEKSNAKASDTEGIIDFVLAVDCVEVAVSILEVGENRFKISLRGKSTDVNAIARVYGGGGHVLASGCMINGYLENVIDELTYTVSQYMD